MAQSSRQTKHVFVTGGVASSLGKGLTASSLGSLLKGRGLRVTMSLNVNVPDWLRLMRPSSSANALFSSALRSDT